MDVAIKPQLLGLSAVHVAPVSKAELVQSPQYQFSAVDGAGRLPLVRLSVF